GGVCGSEVAAVGAVEAEFAVGGSFDAVAVVEHAVVAAAAVEAFVDVGVAAGFPGVQGVDVAGSVLAASESALAAVAHADGPGVGGVPVPGFAAQVERFAGVADNVG